MEYSRAVKRMSQNSAVKPTLSSILGDYIGDTVLTHTHHYIKRDNQQGQETILIIL